jgi:alpha-ketoglutarate-dependent taurine dioxygenase
VGAIETAPQTATAAPFTVRPLSRALGAEILGVDLRDPIDEALKQKLLDTWHQHLVILLRDQTLDEDTQVRFAELFGPPAPVTSGRTFSVKHPAVMLISNIRQDGKPIGALPDGEMNFHTRPVPPARSGQGDGALCHRGPEGGRQYLVRKCLRGLRDIARGDQAAPCRPARTQRLRPGHDPAQRGL